MRKTILVYSLVASALLVLFNLRKWSLFSQADREELWAVVFGLVFIAVGVWISRYFQAGERKEALPGSPEPDPEKIRELGITPREYEVLRLIAEGHSNLEIANRLFISESTVKTHASNLLTKLDARRRTEAVRKAKALSII